jgi:hypothetical protein
MQGGSRSPSRLRITGRDGEGSIAFMTKALKDSAGHRLRAGRRAEWRVRDLGSQAAYPTIAGGIFELGFADTIQRMWATSLDERRGPRCAIRSAA